jgi:hypothetical protein
MTFALCDGLSPVIFFFVKNETGFNFGWQRVSIGGDGSYYATHTGFDLSLWVNSILRCWFI